MPREYTHARFGQLPHPLTCKHSHMHSFLNDAFGGPHPADDPGNNPFAEGGHETGPEPEEEQQGHAANRSAAQHPLGALFSLFGQVLGGHGGGFGLPTHANAGDYVWGSEANFQQLLNDLMEQVRLLVLLSLRGVVRLNFSPPRDRLLDEPVRNPLPTT